MLEDISEKCFKVRGQLSRLQRDQCGTGIHW